ANSPPAPRAINLICHRIRPVEERTVRSRLKRMSRETNRTKNWSAPPGQPMGIDHQPASRRTIEPTNRHFLKMTTNGIDAKVRSNSHFHFERKLRTPARA